VCCGVLEGEIFLGGGGGVGGDEVLGLANSRAMRDAKKIDRWNRCDIMDTLEV